MKKKNIHYSALGQLAEYSVGAERDPSELTSEELSASLTEQGVDLMKLDQTALRRVKRLKNEMNAALAAEKLRSIFRPKLSIAQMRQALESEGQLFAAKAKGTLEDADIEAIYRLTHPEDSEPEGRADGT